MANRDDPYYLHSFHHPGVVLVSQQLTGDNFNSLRCAMIMALDGMNKAGFVDGTIPKLEENPPQFRSWMRNNNTCHLGFSVQYPKKLLQV